MLLPLTLSMGAGIDFSRAHLARAKLRNIADGAALAAATAATKDKGKMTTVAKGYVESASIVAEQADIGEVKVTFPTDNTVRVEIIGSLETVFMRVVGQEIVDLNVVAEAVRGTSATLEVAFALDVTGSMNGSKLSTLKTAARNLIDTLEEDEDADVKYALAPFNTHVNVGMSRRNEPWINVPPDGSPKWVCHTHTPSIGDSKTYGPPTTSCAMRTDIWYGCVGSRAYPLAVQDTSPATRYPGLLTWSRTCPVAEIVPLTSDAGSIKSAISAMTAAGDTYIPAGLQWGWNLLSPGVPFTDGKAYDTENRDPRKVLILMSDGTNTRSPASAAAGGHWDPSGVRADQYTRELCANIKARNIEIFTIAFAVTDVPTKTMLEECASGSTRFFDASNNAALLTAFEEISDALKTVRIQS